jgi:phenylacetate-CoA ligase
MSSGTTGKPTTMLWTKHDLDVECELSARNHYRMGIRPGMVLVGAHPGYLNGGQSLQQASYDYMGCLLVSIGPPESMEAAERALKAVSGLPVDRWQLFPAALQRLHEAAQRIGFTGLPSPEAGRAESQYDKISAGQECVAYLGSTCGQSPGAHLAEDLALVEVLDVHTGEPVDDGQRGQLVVTSLNRDNPMLRYNVEDIVRIDASPCPCGETTRRGFFEGRTKDIVPVGDRAILPIDIAKALPAGTEFVMLRHPTPTDTLHVRIEGPADSETRERISVAAGMPVDIDWVAAGSLPRAAYKAQRVIDVSLE